MKITIIAGARPNFMKIAPIVHAIESAKTNGKNISYRLVFTGTKDDNSIDASLFSDLDMKEPDVYLGVQHSSSIAMAANIMMEFEKELMKNPSDLVLVVDDLTATMSCSIVAKKRGLKVAHLVAGTRSFDINMPKEVNRVITDGLADYLFTAGMVANKNLNQTGAESKKIYYVGNVLIDSIRYNRNRLIRPMWFGSLGLEEKKYILLTINRRTLTSNKEKLKEIVSKVVEKSNGSPIIAPLHNYVREAIEKLNIKANNLHIIPSQSYLSFGFLVNNAMGIVTDSGNVAEEATFLNIPCITLNDFAEHPETYKVGTNMLVGEDVEALSQSLEVMIKGEWKKGVLPEKWDGRTSERIVQILTETE